MLSSKKFRYTLRMIFPYNGKKRVKLGDKFIMLEAYLKNRDCFLKIYILKMLSFKNRELHPKNGFST